MPEMPELSVPGGGDEKVSDAKNKAQSTATQASQANPLMPFQYFGVGSVLIGTVLYVILVFSVAWCYQTYKGPRLESTYLPEDGFSDAIWACSSSWKVCGWACCCPCIRWSDTAAQMGYMNYYIGIAVWVILGLVNSAFAGIGVMLIIALGAFY